MPDLKRIHLNPKKLLGSKWTSAKVVNKEKHFIVSKLKLDENGQVTECVIEAVISRRQQAIDWQQLKNPQQWRQGWLS